MRIHALGPGTHFSQIPVIRFAADQFHLHTSYRTGLR